MSPLLRVLKGTLKVYDITSYDIPAKKILECEVNVEQNSLGFSSNEGIPSKLMGQLRDYIDPIITSYFNGMILQSEIYSWIWSSEGKSYDKWLEERIK